jgi:hypothetical protein
MFSTARVVEFGEQGVNKLPSPAPGETSPVLPRGVRGDADNHKHHERHSRSQYDKLGERK